MRRKIWLDRDWVFNRNWEDNMRQTFPEDLPGENVVIPHTVRETRLHYFDESEYQTVSGYRRVIRADRKLCGRHVEITFEGAAHAAEVYLNGEKVGESHCGYTAFTADLTGKLQEGDNLLSVRLDSRESLDQPPFGYVIDYMTYGGIYRDVYLTVTDEVRLRDVFAEIRLAGLEEKKGKRFCEKSAVILRLEGEGLAEGDVISFFLRKKSEDPEMERPFTSHVVDKTDADAGDVTVTADTGCVELWDIENPVQYVIRTALSRDGQEKDSVETVFGFRQAKFRKDGFVLNGRRVKIRGLNRHQSYPYVGYAMPDSLQQEDVEILKKLGCNAVRTSHYPQSQGFISACDAAGLLVFTEMPGWQHIGGDVWKDQAVKNTEDMIRQYRNHPSIILWGVRINESADDDIFYARTNEAAHALDPSRQTGGVRCYKKGSLLEDVYTYNDFSHTGNNRGCEPKSMVTSDMEKPYLISEYNGHMYPTKPYDPEEHRLSHALRHARVLDDVAGSREICGSFGWCMFDYNTHQDFGSGDRICYHGVLDMFRNPKMAAYVYASQQEEVPVLEVSSSFDIGEHPGGNRGKIYIFTNADSVRMYVGDTLIREYTAADSEYRNLPHGPIRIRDYIGDRLEKGENMDHREAETLKTLFNQAAESGLYGMSKGTMLKALGAAARYRLTVDEAVKLYNKYIGGWGRDAAAMRFEAVKDGKVVKTVVKQPCHTREIRLSAARTHLSEEHTWDCAAVSIRSVDENGNVLYFDNDPVILSVSGPFQLVGPSVVGLAGGQTGTYVRTTGKSGTGVLTAVTPDGISATLSLSAEVETENTGVAEENA